MNVSQEASVFSAPQLPLPAGEILAADGHACAGHARARPHLVAERASAPGQAAIPIWTGTARIQGDFADPLPEAPLEVDRQGIKSVG